MGRSFLPEAIIASIPIALLYFLGWAYLAHLMGRFGIDITAVEIPFQTVLVFSFRPLSEPEFQIGLAFAVILAFLTKYFLYAQGVKIIDSTIAISGSVILLPFVMFLLVALAQHSADSFAWKVWNGDRVRIKAHIVQEDGSDMVADYVHCIRKNWLINIISFHDRSFFLCTGEDEFVVSGQVFQTNSEGRVKYAWQITRYRELGL